MEYPIFLNVKDRLCVVVGGGTVGRRKVEGLLAAGARVRLIEPRVPFEENLSSGLEVVAREYRAGDLRDSFLAFAATGDRNVNAAVADEARRLGVPINVANAPGEGNFSLPARFSRGDLCVAVSTSGRSPALAVLVKDYLASVLGDEWSDFLDIVAAVRRKRLAENGLSALTEGILGQLLEKDFPGLIGRGDLTQIDNTLGEVLGPGYSLAELGVTVTPAKA